MVWEGGFGIIQKFRLNCIFYICVCIYYINQYVCIYIISINPILKLTCTYLQGNWNVVSDIIWKQELMAQNNNEEDY